MGGKVISHVQLSPTLRLTECKDGFWFYDETRGMNLAMRAKTEREAFVEALTYYQGRLKALETEHYALADKVDAFIQQVLPKESDDR